jgi:membrane dipeptidase
VVDLHADVPWRVAETGYDPLRDAPGEHVDLFKLRDGGVALLGMVIYTPADQAGPERAPEYGRRLLEIVRDLADRSRGALRLVATREDVVAAIRRPDEKGPAMLLTMEGVAPLAGSVDNLDPWLEAGVRVIGLTHNPRNAAGDGTGVPVEERSGSLTDFGRDLVARMGEVGVLPDIAHLAEECCDDLFAAATGPVVCTHAGTRALKDHWRNLSDDQIRAIAATGGYVGIDAYPGHVGRERGCTVDDVVDHMEHVASLVGHEHVGVGADFAGFDGEPCVGLEDAGRYPVLARRLADRGWTRVQVEGALYGNALRVLETVLP